MTKTLDSPSRKLRPETVDRYDALSADARYGHFVRIPQRICRCLDYFKVLAPRASIIERLHAYYLFIGVVDDLIDSTSIEAGRDVLCQLAITSLSFDSETVPSPADLVTEVLKAHINPPLYPQVLAKFEELYQAAVGERAANTSEAFIEERKAVGRLTAELSYILIRPLLEREEVSLRCFLMEVGEVGCLIDSLIDLSADHEQCLLSFNPTLRDRLAIVAQVMRKGAKLSLAHPRLIILFLEAVRDNLLDRVGSRIIEPRPALPSVIVPRTRVTGSEPLAAAVWTKP